MRHVRQSATREDLLIGAHQSIAGGLHLAFERAERIGCRTLQLFTKSTNQWRAKPLSAGDIASYKTACTKSTIRNVMAHTSYLINLCSNNPEILRKSRESYLEEVRRCELLGIRYLNVHPGAHMGAGEEDGIRRIIESLDVVHDATKDSPVVTVLETTAGQGTCVGHRFEHLRAIIEGVAAKHRMAACIDTCHVFAAGYDISTAAGYRRTMEEFGSVVGFARLAAIHTNDSKKPLGSRVDRHEHIGKGAIGKLAFHLLLTDERLRHIPKFLETPKGEDLAEDRVNLRTLRALARLSSGRGLR